MRADNRFFLLEDGNVPRTLDAHILKTGIIEESILEAARPLLILAFFCFLEGTILWPRQQMRTLFEKMTARHGFLPYRASKENAFAFVSRFLLRVNSPACF